MAPEQPRRLGRGLEALLAISKPATPDARATAAKSAGGDETTMRTVRIAEIRPNPYQPRKEFKLEELAELQASLKASGLLQPIAVRPSPTGTGYELIAGERRFRAATALGWTEIPAVVHPIDDRTLLTLALIENLQRSNLNALEEAEGYKRLIDEFGLTQVQVGEFVGKDRSTVANLLRLLTLPAAVRRLLNDGAIQLGHARALLGLADERLMTDLAREAASHGMSVREVERRVQAAGGTRRAAPAKPAKAASGEVRRLEDQLRRHLQTDVAVRVTKGKKSAGEIRVHFYNDDDLTRVLDLILGHDRD
jgi:ParB family chromosome partitioning protein